MLSATTHGDVTRLALSAWTSRAVGYAVSAYHVRGVLIDCGFPRVRGELRQFAREHDLRAIMLTHSHEDHAGNAALAAEFRVPLVAAESTMQVLRAAPRIELYRRLVWGQPERLDLDAATRFDEGLRLIHTPGHAGDHHIVWDMQTDTVFGGDLFLGVRVRVAHAEERPAAHIRSLRQVADLHPRRLFDAHRGPVPEPRAALLAKARWMEDTIGAVEQRIAQGWSDRAIARAVLGRETVVNVATSGNYTHINFVKAVRRELGNDVRSSPAAQTTHHQTAP